MLRVIEPAASYDLTTLDAARAECGVTGSAQDAALLRMIRAASDAIASHCGTPFARELVEQTEMDIAGARAIILDRIGDIEIASIEENSVAVDADGWDLDGRLLRRRLGGVRCHWPGWRVTITYRAGWQLMGSLPYSVEQAALSTVAAWWSQRSRPAGLRSETIEGIGSFSYATPGADSGGLTPDAIRLLAPFRPVIF